MSDPALQDVYGTVRIPLVNVKEARTLGGAQTGTTDLNYINCYPVVATHPVTGESEFFVQKRQGVNNTDLPSVRTIVGGTNPLYPIANIGFAQLSDVCVGAWFEDVANIIHIIQYRPSAATMLQIGQFAATTAQDQVFFTEVMVGTTELPALAVTWCSSNLTSSKGFSATSAIGGAFTAASLTQIVDVNFPANVAGEVLVGGIQQLNSYFYAFGRSGKIYQCANAYNITVWSSNRIIETYSYPDKGIGIFRYKHHLVAFSDTTIEFFNDSGARGDGSTVSNSLERTEQAFIKFGAINAKCVKNIDDVLYWIGSSDTSTTGVWKMDGYTPVKISTIKEDAVIQTSLTGLGFSNTSNRTFLDCISIQGSKHLIITDMTSQFNELISFSGLPAADDQWGGDTFFDAVPGMLCFALDSKSWWFLADTGYTGLNSRAGLSWIPCSYFDRNESYNYYTQLILKRPTIGNQEGDVRDFGYIYSLDSVAGNWNDRVGTDADVVSRHEAIAMYIQTNPIDSSTSQGKLIRRLTLNHDSPLSQIVYSFPPYTYIKCSQDDFNSPSVLKDMNNDPMTTSNFYPVRMQWPNSAMRSLENLIPGNFYSPAGLAIPGATSFTLEGWFKRGSAFATNPVGNVVIGYASSASTTDIGWVLRFIRSDPNWVARLAVATINGDNFDTHVLQFPTQLQTNAPFWTDWAYIAFVVDLVNPANCATYINFVQQPLVQNLTAPSVRTPGSPVTWVGGRPAPWAIDGSILMSNVRLWKNQKRTPAQMRAAAYDQYPLGADYEMNPNQEHYNYNEFSQRTDLSLAVPSYTRTYINSPGKFRKGSFMIYQKTPYDMRMKSLDLTMYQGRN